MFRFFKSDFFDFEFLRVIGTAPVQGAEIGECLEAASRIADGDIESWFSVWTEMGSRAEQLAAEAEAVHDTEGARWAYLRASNYWRASEFFLHCNPSDPRIARVFSKSVQNFRSGLKLLDGAVHFLSIPYDSSQNLHLPGYLLLPPNHKTLPGATPLIIHTGGFDSIGEELYYYVASGATARGYAVLIFDGPGQGELLRNHKLPFRPDWEHVVGKVLDYVAGNPTGFEGIDQSRIAIFGASMGGYLALRGAADKRIKACISCDGFYDMFDITRSRMPSWFIDLWLNGTMSDSIFNSIVNLLSRFNFQLAWEFGHSMWSYGVTSPADVMRVMQQFTLKTADEQEFLHRLDHCAVMVTGAADTMYFTPDINARRIFEKLDHVPPHRKHLWVPQGVSNGGLQAKIAAIGIKQQRMFAWLDEQFKISR